MRPISRRLLWPALAVLFLALVAVGAVALRPELDYLSNRNLILQAALRYAIPPALLGAVAWQETRFHADRQGLAGEIGLMQVTPGAAIEWARAERNTGFQSDHLWNPLTNTLAAAWYLQRAATRWNVYPEPLPYVLAEYNAGHRNAARWAALAGTAAPTNFVSAITYPSTQRYVREVIRYFQRFQQVDSLLGTPRTQLPPPPIP